MILGDPKLVRRPVYGRFKLPVEVADFSEEERPAFRVGCHCRNCSWKAEARFAVGVKVPPWLRCPKCETVELSAHGEFLGRDEQTREEEREAYKRYAEEERVQFQSRGGALRP